MRILNISIIMILLLATILLLGKAMQKTELEECIEWSMMQSSVPTFYLTEWQEMQCDHYGVSLGR